MTNKKFTLMKIIILNAKSQTKQKFQIKWRYRIEKKIISNIIFILNILYWISFVEWGLVGLHLFNNALMRIDRLFLSNGICGYLILCISIISHILFILLDVQNCRGRPRFLFSISHGSVDLEETATWYNEYYLFLLKICPRNFKFIFSRISVRGLIYLSNPSDDMLIISLILLYIYIYWIIALHEYGM
jgi:hypothetical protein